MSTCIIVGAGEFCASAFAPSENDFIIAADGGYATLEKLGVIPDIVMGDFDSLGYVPRHPSVQVFPCIKDDPDMMLAAQEGLSRGYRRFELFGGLGGRLAHSVANLQILQHLAKNGAENFLIGTDETATALSAGTEITFSAAHVGYLSAFCLSGSAVVTMTGLKYELERGELVSTRPLGLSNEFLGCEARVRAENGIIVLLWRTQLSAADRIVKRGVEQ